MWRIVFQSVQGERHRVDGVQCQDCSLASRIGEGKNETLVACVADGAGSSMFSGVGSRMTCETIIQSATDRFASPRSLASLQPADVVEWCEGVRRTMSKDAHTNRRQLSDYASTMCGAVIAPGRSIFFQIGDGAIVVRRNGVLGVVFWPQSGEYINATNFLTSPNFHKLFQVCAIEGEFSDVALLTDGVERIALQFETQSPHVPFFRPLLAGVRATSNLDVLNNDLRRFLESEAVTNKSDDDKTLLLACRIADELGLIA